MRSGENAACFGCHENRYETPISAKLQHALALQRSPSQLKKWYGAERNFSYQNEVQPVWDILH